MHMLIYSYNKRKYSPQQFKTFQREYISLSQNLNLFRELNSIESVKQMLCLSVAKWLLIQPFF